MSPKSGRSEVAEPSALLLDNLTQNIARKAGPATEKCSRRGLTGKRDHTSEKLHQNGISCHSFRIQNVPLSLVPKSLGCWPSFGFVTTAECQAMRRVEFPERQGCAVKGMGRVEKVGCILT
jgi:hypothetical protein